MLVFLALAAAADPVTALDADRARIRTHLGTVEAELRAAPVAQLSAVQRTNRAAALDTLHAYRLAGEFPRNTEVPGERVPVFRDANGRDCAVGALVRASGAAALADAVDARWHLARVPEMDEPALARWGADHGFTVAELARIQPNYCMCEDDEGYAPVCGADGVTYWNSCVAETCAGTEAVDPGACDYSRDVCPAYEATDPPAVNQCDNMWELCTADEPVYDETWADWLAAQDQACLESSGEQFDGPDDVPAEGAPATGCAIPTAPGLLGLLCAAWGVGRRLGRTRAHRLP